MEKEKKMGKWKWENGKKKGKTIAIISTLNIVLL